MVYSASIKLARVALILLKITFLIHSCYVTLPANFHLYVLSGETADIQLGSLNSTDSVHGLKALHGRLSQKGDTHGRRIRLRTCDYPYYSEMHRICSDTKSGKIRIYIRNVTFKDNGSYRGKIYYHGKKRCKLVVSFQVIVQVMPNIYSNCTDITLQVGQSITCSCTATNGNPSATISWTHNSTGQGISGKEVFKDILTLGNVSRSNSGTYTCLARSHNLVNKTSFNLTVQPNTSSTKVKIKYFKVVQEIGTCYGKLFLICLAKSIPTPRYVISHNGTDVTFEEIYTVISGKVSSVGEYECRVRNRDGVDKRSLFLNASMIVESNICLDNEKVLCNYNGEITWQIMLIVGACSFLVGILLLYVLMCLCRKIRKTSQRYENSGTVSSPESRRPRCVQGLEPMNENEENEYENENNYQELSEFREKDEENYQSLKPTAS